MQRSTLSNFRAQWPSEAMGICQADPRVRDYCNDSQERLLIDPQAPDEGWLGGWVTLNLTAVVSCGAAYVTVPREICRLIDLAVCQRPIHIRNGFYEYLKWGAGLEPKACRTGACGQTFQAFERDNVPTLFPLQGTSLIRMYPTDNRDIGRRVLLQGKDQNGQVILTTDPGTGKSAQGEYVQLAFPFKTSVNQFSTISGIQKDETWGNVQFFAVDPITLVEVPLSVMEPNEGTGWYRRYLINGIPYPNLCCNTTSLALPPVSNPSERSVGSAIPLLVLGHSGW